MLVYVVYERQRIQINNAKEIDVACEEVGPPVGEVVDRSGSLVT